MKEYQISKQRCKEMVGNRVCSYCGRKVKPIETTDNAGNPTFWGGCYHGGDCGNIEWGVEKETYRLAKRIVLNGEYSYPKDYESNFNYWFYGQIHKATELIRKVENSKKGRTRLNLKSIEEYYLKCSKVNL